MQQTDTGPVNLSAALTPETHLERHLLSDPVFVEGLLWGVPRYGHPEGEVYKHIREVLANVGKLNIPDQVRKDLRLIAYVHDTFKYLEDKREPRDWSKHHGMLARRYMEPFLDKEHLLDIIELHDEAYYIWREAFTHRKPDAAKPRLRNLLDKLGDNLQLFYLFFVCDTMTGDKILSPLNWFEQVVPEIHVPEIRLNGNIKPV